MSDSTPNKDTSITAEASIESVLDTQTDTTVEVYESVAVYDPFLKPSENVIPLTGDQDLLRQQQLSAAQAAEEGMTVMQPIEHYDEETGTLIRLVPIPESEFITDMVVLPE